MHAHVGITCTQVRQRRSERLRLCAVRAALDARVRVPCAHACTAIVLALQQTVVQRAALVVGGKQRLRLLL